MIIIVIRGGYTDASLNNPDGLRRSRRHRGNLWFLGVQPWLYGKMWHNTITLLAVIKLSVHESLYHYFYCCRNRTRHCTRTIWTRVTNYPPTGTATSCRCTRLEEIKLCTASRWRTSVIYDKASYWTTISRTQKLVPTVLQRGFGSGFSWYRFHIRLFLKLDPFFSWNRIQINFS